MAQARTATTHVAAFHRFGFEMTFGFAGLWPSVLSRLRAGRRRSVQHYPGMPSHLLPVSQSLVRPLRSEIP